MFFAGLPRLARPAADLEADLVADLAAPRQSMSFLVAKEPPSPRQQSRPRDNTRAPRPAHSHPKEKLRFLLFLPGPKPLPGFPVGRQWEGRETGYRALGP